MLEFAENSRQTRTSSAAEDAPWYGETSKLGHLGGEWAGRTTGYSASTDLAPLCGQGNTV